MLFPRIWVMFMVEQNVDFYNTRTITSGGFRKVCRLGWGGGEICFSTAAQPLSLEF